MTRLQRSILFAGSLLLAMSVRAQGDALRGATLVQQGDGNGGAACLSCHGSDGAGNDSLMAPRLAGLDATYLRSQLLAYQQGRRQGALMLPNVQKLTPQQIADVAAYYAGQHARAAKAPAATREQLTLGERLATRGDRERYIVACSTCHGPGNRGVGSDFPALAGQHAAYLQQQIHEWQNGNRHNDPDQLMLAIAGRLNEAEIQAVALYLAGLPPKE
ncbi:MAG TPA: c-type cytochrome [Candidatus Acidoferrum sp.]|nr:c-type cytochrome [Candidatus Acidoferrum sp.]